MNNNRIRMAALLACWLCLMIAAPAAQAQYTCAHVLGEEWLNTAEWTFYKANCQSGLEDDDDEEEEPWRPPEVTCPHLPPDRAVVSGYAEYTQCQMVSELVIGVYPDLVARGFIDAVDVWSYVNGGLEVCFRHHGWLVFLDATYMQRTAMELEHYQRDGMTCGAIDRIGTVVLLAAGPSSNMPATQEPTEPVAQPEVAPLPTFEAIPLADCQIKLVQTLYLRATPGGEIIGLVWLNSEVPAFEINGYWYQVEFEGKTGYISRYHRRVLRGGCG